MTAMILKNVELHWAKLDKAVSAFGGDMAYEVQCRVAKSRKKELVDAAISFKEVDGKLAFNMKRYAQNVKGEATAVDVVDMDKQATAKDNIGNGTIANVRLWQYKNKRGGMTSRLMAVQIAKLVEYKAASEVDFD